MKLDLLVLVVYFVKLRFFFMKLLINMLYILFFLFILVFILLFEKKEKLKLFRIDYNKLMYLYFLIYWK